MENIVILGSGPAGLTAALYAARAELNPLVLTGKTIGGQLTLTTDVENYPGFPDGIQGPDLMKRMQKQAEKYGARIKIAEAKSIKKADGHIELETDEGSLQTKALIIATGASARWLGIESEAKFKGRGVHTCATCDGYFYKDKNIIVIGGGDTACEEASYLAKVAKSVTMAIRGEDLTASKIMASRVKKNDKIKVMPNVSIVEFKGDKMLSSVMMKDLKTEEVSEQKIDGVFIAIGYIPNTKMVEGVVELTDKGVIKVDEKYRTSVPGIFAAGDIEDAFHRQAICAAGAGAAAAIEAERHLHTLEDKT